MNFSLDFKKRILSLQQSEERIRELLAMDLVFVQSISSPSLYPKKQTTESQNSKKWKSWVIRQKLIENKAAYIIQSFWKCAKINVNNDLPLDLKPLLMKNGNEFQIIELNGIFDLGDQITKNILDDILSSSVECEESYEEYNSLS